MSKQEGCWKRRQTRQNLMIRAISTGITLFLAVGMIAACATEGVLQSTKIEGVPEARHIRADKVPRKMLLPENKKMISDLRTELAAAREQEAVLNDEIAKLKRETEAQESVLNDQIARLKKEIDEKDNIISIQGKVIGLLDDADKTLQKSIEAQINSR